VEDLQRAGLRLGELPVDEHLRGVCAVMQETERHPHADWHRVKLGIYRVGKGVPSRTMYGL
jgi:hypothetical protein